MSHSMHVCLLLSVKHGNPIVNEPELLNQQKLITYYSILIVANNFKWTLLVLHTLNIHGCPSDMATLDPYADGAGYNRTCGINKLAYNI